MNGKAPNNAAVQVVEAKAEVAVFNRSRLPYHPVLQERFGVDRAAWTVLTESVFPNAKTVNSVAMALAYCKARNLDVLKRVVNIVPMWSTAAGTMVETIWPSIAELRTTAHRTGGYAGIDAAEFGPMIEKEFTGRTKGREPTDLRKKVRFPEWCRYTVYRMVSGARCAFVGPTVYWLESYADQGGSGVPNSMWGDERPIGQLDKVAEAAALRRAFPEELGNIYAAEEMEGRTVVGGASVAAPVEEASNAKTTPPRPALAGPPKAPPPNGGGQPDPQRQRAGGPPAGPPGDAVEEAEVVGEGRQGAEASGRDVGRATGNAGSVADGAAAEPPGVGPDGRVADYAAFAAWTKQTLIDQTEDATGVWDTWEAQIAPYRERMPPNWYDSLKGVMREVLTELMGPAVDVDG